MTKNTIPAPPKYRRRLYHAEAATRVGVAASTWRDYHADGRTPPPDGTDSNRGHVRPWWYPETLDAWNATRPRRGARTDLSREITMDDDWTTIWRRIQETVTEHPMVTFAEAAELAGTSKDAIKAAWRSGWIRSVRPGHAYATYLVRDNWMQDAMGAYFSAHPDASREQMTAYARRQAALRET